MVAMNHWCYKIAVNLYYQNQEGFTFLLYTPWQGAKEGDATLLSPVTVVLEYK